MSLKRDILWRVGIVYIGALSFALLIVGKIIYIQFFEGSKWKQWATDYTLKEFVIEPKRGDIYDEEKRLLASSVPYYSIYMDFKSEALKEDTFNKYVDSLSIRLSDLFKDQSAYDYKMKLIRGRKEGYRYHLIKSNVTYPQLQQCKTFPIFRDGRYAGGFMFEQVDKRVRPHSDLAFRTIGYLNLGSSGNVVGLEGAYDHYLKGIEGVRLKQKISGGIWMPVNDGNEVEPKDGKDIISTLNIDMQEYTHYALLSELIKTRAHHGCAILMEVHSGEIKAIVNLKRTKNGDYSELYNYAVGELSEPGSTFKLASVIAALEDGKTDVGEIIDAENGIKRYPGVTIKDVHRGLGKITLEEAFELSSNVAISKIIYKSYKDNERAFVDRLFSMNLHEQLNLEIKGEGKPQINYPGDKNWFNSSLVMMSIGYEVRLTPLQLLTFYNAIANDGVMIKPIFVKEISDHGKLEKTFESEIINRSICSKSTLKKVQDLLRGVVLNGTAAELKNCPFDIAGKTGTAEIYNPEKGEYVDKHIAWFVGYFPYDKPKYSCLVMINNPATGGYASQVAVPVFDRIARKLYTSKFNQVLITDSENLESIPYTKSGSKKELQSVLEKLGYSMTPGNLESKWIRTERRSDHILASAYNTLPGLVPNVVGMGIKDAVYIMEQAGLKVSFSGRGTVTEQSMMPGERINKGDEVKLTMSF